ncbi:radical SAM protein [Bacillus cereus group sp. N11]|uniref:radical SAM protein n=1 Tax=Bacillus cereus group sp. N11 TaxID=2794585 RepID=UPI0018F7646E|nr:radical SAM protein [Bacillus cereus group sp. N11]MBJ8098415.1 radical SAM protein [Bacillus cereus group sp. N11]
MKKYFIYNEHLGIAVPNIQEEWEDISEKTQHGILLKWEQIRGKIPDRIKELEHYINQKQHRLNNEDNFEISCRLNSEIADLASIINDLWLWYRLTQNVSEGKAHQ